MHLELLVLLHTGSYTASVASVMLPLLLLMLLLAFAVVSCYLLLLLHATAAIMYITTAAWLLELLQLCYYTYFSLNFKYYFLNNDHATCTHPVPQRDIQSL